MNFCEVELAGARMKALGSGALAWPAARMLVVSDLHLGKSERIARRSGGLLPPYESRDTLDRLERDVAAARPDLVICLGDSFDDDDARAGLGHAERARIAAMQAGRDWIWIAGNHDPAPADLGGTARPEVRIGPLVFRHIARPGATGEVSGHFHPKARLVLKGRMISRPCFLHDGTRLILPAYGTYTGGLDWTAPALAALMGPGARAVLTGPAPCVLPVPQRGAA